MPDRIIGGSFTRGNNKQKKSYAATTRDVGRIMRLFDRTVAALEEAQESGTDGFAAVDAAVGWDKLLRARGEARVIADLAGENPLVRAADQWSRLRKFAPLLLEAIEFKAGRGSASTITAVNTLREMNRSGRRDVPADAPMPFRKQWRTLIKEGGGKPDRRLWETGVMAHLRNKWRSGDVWVERSSNYRKFDSYMLPAAEAVPIAADLKLPATADEWIADRGRELDWRLKRFAHRLARGQVEGVALKDGKLSIAPVRADESAAAKALAARIDGLMPRVRITELPPRGRARHRLWPGVSQSSHPRAPRQRECAARRHPRRRLESRPRPHGRSQSGRHPRSAYLDQVRLHCPRQLQVRARAHYRRPPRAANRGGVGSGNYVLVRRPVLPLGQARKRRGRFQRQIRRRSGLLLLHPRLRPARTLPHHGHLGRGTRSALCPRRAAPPWDRARDRHALHRHWWRDRSRLCALPDARLSLLPALRDFPDRRMACIEAPGQYPSLKPLMGARVKVDVIREHWDEIVRLVTSLKAGTVLPSAMLRKLAAYERQNQLDLALREIGRVERTLFMLDWLESPALRRRCQAGLNKSEQRHFLTGAICTFKQGRIADRTHEAQQFRASGLNLIIAAIVYWNSTYIADAVAHLRSIGEPAPDELLAHTSPVGWGHIAFSGDFLWDRAAAMPIGRRPLNTGRVSMAA